MSVQPGPTFKRYAANGVATVYTIPFLLLDAADLQITLDGTLVTTGFTLTGIGSPQSTCTFTVAPAGDLLFQMSVPFQRLADYQINGDFLAQTVNRDFDRLWLAVKQLNRDSSRALTVSLLEPEGIPPLPVKATRALKMLAFDASGNPITSNLTLAQIEQQPALALGSAAQAAASALSADQSAISAGQSASTATTAKNAAAASASAAAASAMSAADTGFQLGMSMWGHRGSEFRGFAPDDGQELSRALYPDFAAVLDAGLLPSVTEALWQSDPTVRGAFVVLSSPGMFRMRDLNGVSAGSIGAVFRRGHPVPVGGRLIQDQMQRIQGATGLNMSSAAPQGAFQLAPISPVGASVTGTTSTTSVTFDSALSARTGTETFPTHARGVWMTRLFGIIAPLGSAEANSLATAYAALASRTSSLELRATALEFGYVSANQTYANNTQVTVNHGLGVIPGRVDIDLIFTTAQHGYAVGSVVKLGCAGAVYISTGPYGFNVEVSTTQISMRIAQGGIGVISKVDGSAQIVTPANAVLRIKASKS
ncbi:hypothetical protein FX985_00646 [Pseudomonas extremaustralis]|uniref:Uncharacterized protein n=1 Tax=Pseudomonas extremaustralis TaxID=359110 RepID=A0A5M9IXZ6_9PSED|nr:hypothetical protein [Pseudomonas extremaustralis]KAA8560596.1 hypothetical protein FX985_00646 [Pseudomonas extremaustralis]